MATGWRPVDYKLTRKVGYHFKVQLAAYALLMEEQVGEKVRHGMLYLIPLRRTETVSITARLRRVVHSALETMQMIADHEIMPFPTDWRQRCVDCEFRRFCNDV